VIDDLFPLYAQLGDDCSSQQCVGRRDVRAATLSL
jgi:hypothetical protein